MLHINCILIKLGLAAGEVAGGQQWKTKMKDTVKEPQEHYLRFWVPKLYI